MDYNFSQHLHRFYPTFKRPQAERVQPDTSEQLLQRNILTGEQAGTWMAVLPC